MNNLIQAHRKRPLTNQTMMQINNRQLKFNSILLIILFILINACSTDDTKKVAEVPAFESEYERLTQSEYDFILKLLKVDVEMHSTWNTFNLLRNHPIFIVTGENQGVLINPPAIELPNSRKITDEIDGYENLELYRNNDLVPFAKAETNGLFWNWSEYNGYNIYVFDRTFEIFDNFYYQYKNRDGHFFPTAFYHELFHDYQLRTVPDQWNNPDSVQDINGYPVNEESLPYLILYFNMMIDAYKLDNTPEQQTKLLSYYVSINHKLLALDTTKNNLVRNHGFSTEKREGVARYVEVYSTLTTLDNDLIEDPTHGYKEYVDSLTNIYAAGGIYSFRMFYHTGAGAIHLMKELGYQDIENAMLIPTNTPFDLANSFLDLSAQEKENALEEAKSMYDWETILARADELLN